MKNYIIGCFIGILYIMIGSIIFGQDLKISVATILFGAYLIVLMPYKNNKSLYWLFIEKYIE